MSIFFSLVPWIIFWVFLTLRMIEAAALGGFAFALIVIFFDVWKKRSMKVLQLGTVVFFLVIAIAAYVVDLDLLGRWVNSSGSIALALIVLISIVIKKPFTLQYAKESTPEEYWESPTFIHVNYVISWAWCLMMSINAILSVLFTTVMPVDTWINWVVSLSCFGAAMAFTEIYRNYLKKK